VPLSESGHAVVRRDQHQPGDLATRREVGRDAAAEAAPDQDDARAIDVGACDHRVEHEFGVGEQRLFGRLSFALAVTPIVHERERPVRRPRLARLPRDLLSIATVVDNER